MQTQIKSEIKNTQAGKEADRILRKCVHCGFCLATCPTYQLLGDERDSPRGRIYLIKSLLEEDVDRSVVQTHLDRCLTCRACETTCPSGVEYGQLLDIGREELSNNHNSRSLLNRSFRWLLRKFLTTRGLFDLSISLAKRFHWLLPNTIKNKFSLSDLYKSELSQQGSSGHQVILFRGCVQPSLTPNTNLITIDVLAELGIKAHEIKNENCCGAISHHLSAVEEAKVFMRNNIDAWWPLIEQDAQAIICTASGCGVMLKDYASLLKDDEKYAIKAKRISALVYDISEYIAEKRTYGIEKKRPYKRVAFHNPCTLQHGQKIQGVVENILERCGYELVNIPDAHMCCGSAGTYSILQSKLSKQLQSKKIQNLESVAPDVIVTANIGCQLQIQEATDIPVMHWIELLR